MQLALYMPSLMKNIVQIFLDFTKYSCEIGVFFKQTEQTAGQSSGSNFQWSN
jgi:hypothetical protein